MCLKGLRCVTGYGTQGLRAEPSKRDDSRTVTMAIAEQSPADDVLKATYDTVRYT